MPDFSKVDSILLKVDIYQKRDRVEFCVMQTPALLWRMLPQEPIYIPDDSIPAVYFKRFTARCKGKFYEFTFYSTARNHDKKPSVNRRAHLGGPGL